MALEFLRSKNSTSLFSTESLDTAASLPPPFGRYPAYVLVRGSFSLLSFFYFFDFAVKFLLCPVCTVGTAWIFLLFCLGGSFFKKKFSKSRAICRVGPYTPWRNTMNTIQFAPDEDIIDICRDNVFKAAFTRDNPLSQGALKKLRADWKAKPRG
jgi:hypothetical protein